jgi:methylenetetrahydrofolate--tRNA-(uracil-5-)-methyltransferase
MIPGLEGAEFLRFGSIHRNSYLNSPASLAPGLTARDNGQLFFAGQITGVEGYTESLGTGLLAGINLARVLHGLPVAIPPATTMLGALYRYLREADPNHFQPMNANFGLLDPLPGKVKKDRKKELLVERSQADFADWLEQSEIIVRGAMAKAHHRGPEGSSSHAAHDIA